MKRLELVGEEFGTLKVVRYAGTSEKGSHSIWECECACGRTVKMRGHVLVHGHPKSCKYCRNKGKKLPTWKGHEDISGAYLYQLKYHAKERGLAFDVSPEYLWQLFLAQGRQCALSGEPIVFARNIFDGSRSQTASLDRIDSSIAYVEGNVHWVHKGVNMLKGKLSVEELMFWCKRLVEHESLAGKLTEEVACPSIAA